MTGHLGFQLEIGQPPILVRDQVYLQQAGGTRARAVLVAASAVSVLLPFLPFGGIVGYPLLLLSTLAHEMGHGLAALLVGLDFDSFRLYADDRRPGRPIEPGSHGGRGPDRTGRGWGPHVLVVLPPPPCPTRAHDIRSLDGHCVRPGRPQRLWTCFRWSSGRKPVLCRISLWCRDRSVHCRAPGRPNGPQCFLTCGLSLHQDGDDERRSNAFRRCTDRRATVLAVLVLGICLRSNFGGSSGPGPVRVLEEFQGAVPRPWLTQFGHLSRSPHNK